ncbi:hypothetical protein ACFWDQ_00375 [Streptomyces sp. NPDC060053]|uniref:hypothetical protein n=1 Tax=Streptomyces sp. NPDC060053 TaxID=3347047 RepID=UPI0036D01D41
MLPGDDRAARRVLTACLAAGATTLLDQSVLDIAVPALRRSLSAGATDVQWIVSGYSPAFGLALVPAAAWVTYAAANTCSSSGFRRTAFAVASVVCAGLPAAALPVSAALPRVPSGAGRVRGRAGAADRTSSEAP